MSAQEHAEKVREEAEQARDERIRFLYSDAAMPHGRMSWGEIQETLAELARAKCRYEIAEAKADALLGMIEEAQEALRAIVEYEPVEVVKDDFAYDRIVESYRACARAALGSQETG